MSTSEQTSAAERQRQLTTNARLYFRILVAVVIVVAAIWVYARYYSGGNPNYTLPQQTSTAVSGKPLFTGLDKFAPTSATVLINGQDIKLSQSADGDWQITSPLDDEANPDAVSELVDDITRLRYAGQAPAGSSAASAGLDKPWFKATLSDGSTTVTVSAGAKNLDGSYDVIKSGSDATIYHVGNVAPFLVDLQPFDLVRQNMLEFQNADVTSIVVQEPGQPTVTLKRNDRGDWVSTLNHGTQPYVVFNVDSFLEGVKYVSATTIVPDSAKEDYGYYPAPGSMRIEFGTKNGKTESLDIGKLAADGRHYYTKATGRPHNYEVVEFVPDNLRARLGDITTNILSFDPANLQQIDVEPTPDDYRTLTSAANFIADMTALQYIQIQQSIGVQLKTDKVTYANENGTWKSNGSVAFGLDNLIQSLSKLQVYSSAPDGSDQSFGFTPDQGSHTVTLTFKDQTQRTFTIGGAATLGDQKGTYAFASNQPDQQWVAPADVVNTINYAVTHVRQTMLAFTPADVTEIKILQGDNTADLKPSGKDWTLDGKAQKAGDTVSKLLDTLSKLDAESLVDASDTSAKGFYPASGGIRVELVLKDGSTQSLDIGSKKQIGSGWFASYDYYVKSGDFAEVGLIPDSSLEDTLNQITALSH